MPQHEQANKQDKIDDLDPHLKKLFKGDGVNFIGNNHGGCHKTADHDQHVR